MKICKKCNINKNFNEFHKRKDSVDGYRNECKECLNKIVKKYREQNVDTVKKTVSKYNLKNSDKRKQKHKIWREQNSVYIKNYFLNNKDNIYKTRKTYYKNNKERFRNYYLNNKDYYKKNQKIYQAYKRCSDPLFKMKLNIRNLIKNSFNNKNFKKECKTTIILGCTFEEFKNYLESKFEPWMNWDNHGKYNGEFNYGWDIDHIIPVSSAQTEDDIIRLNHFTNLQPLCSKFNRVIKR